MKKQLRIALVGTGKVATGQHIPLWQRIPNSKIVAVCDVDRNAAEKAARSWCIDRVYSSFEELLDREPTGLVVDLCTPPAFHVPQAIAALEAGHHVLLEKPISLDRDEVHQLLETCLRCAPEVQLCVVHTFLYVWPIPRIQEMIRRQGLSVVGVDIHHLHTVEDEMLADRGHWVHKLPGGRFGENLIHPVYVLSSLIGDLELDHVFAAKHGPHDWVPYDELVASFHSGPRHGRIHLSFNSPRWTTPLSLSVYAKEAIIHFDGSNIFLRQQHELMKGYLPDVKVPRGKLAADRLGLAFEAFGSTATLGWKVLRHRLRPGHELLFHAFAASLLNGTPPPVDAAQACRATLTFLDTLDCLPSAPPSGREGL